MEKAFEIMAEEYRPMLFSYARTLMNGDEHEAEDVVQETFITAQNRLESFRLGENFGGWLRGIARNKALESRRAARNRRAIVDSRIIEGMEDVYAIFDAPAADGASWAEQIRASLTRCIERLNRTLQEAVLRVYREGLSLREAAAALQSSPVAVAQRLSRARNLLRQCVGNRMEDEP
ncbi:MAG: sigma-70 family RNA polymerase sigma factor [Pirellulales bacterium]|nr:sigma-70 family RNA polymerase sigma factor [Pirellulales bacterium]